MQHDEQLLRAAGLAALAGAVLRSVFLFAPRLGLEWLYLTVDVLCTAALVGLFAGHQAFRSWVGPIGFVGAMVGFDLIRTGRLPGGPDPHQPGPTVVAVSLAVCGIALWRAGGLGRWAGLAWISSLLVGVATLLHPSQGLLFGILLFIVGFGLGGLSLLVGRRS